MHKIIIRRLNDKQTNNQTNKQTFSRFYIFVFGGKTLIKIHEIKDDNKTVKD